MDEATAELNAVKERVDSLNGVMEEMKKEVIEYGSANRAVAVLRAGTFNEVWDTRLVPPSLHSCAWLGHSGSSC